MGWRVGQGIGPRITYAQRKAQDTTYGNASIAEDAEDDEARKHMYPRRDTPLLIVPKKENTHGLGYIPNAGLMADLGSQGSVPKGQNIAGNLCPMSFWAFSNRSYDQLDLAWALSMMQMKTIWMSMTVE